MFKAHNNHLQGEIFGKGNQLPEKLKKRLKKHWAPFFYDNIFRNIDESKFENIYGETGRPNFPVNIMVGLEILKEIHGLSDEQLYDRYHFDYTYQCALGVENIEQYTFAIRTLYHFRAAVADYNDRFGIDLYNHVFEAGRDKMIEEIGIKTNAARTDSVMIAANIKRMGRVSLFHKVFSNLVCELESKKIRLSSKYTDYLKHDEDGFNWRLDQSKKEEVLTEIGTMLREILLNYPAALAGTKGKADAERLVGEHCEINSGKVSLKPPKDISSGAMQNPADGDATYRKKRNEEHHGYSTHAVETCNPENPAQAIMSVNTVRNNVDDAKVLADELDDLNEVMGLDLLVTDGGFVSNDVRKQCEQKNINFVATAIRGKAKKSDALISTDFPIKSGLISHCPAGHAPKSRSIDKSGTSSAVFCKLQCGACNLKERCIAYRKNGNGRIKIDPHRKWLDERIHLMGEKAFTDLCRLRPAVEGLMEKLKPKILNGRILFRGLTKVKSRMKLRGIGLNFKRYHAWYFYVLLMHFNVWVQNRKIGNFGAIRVA